MESAKTRQFGDFWGVLRLGLAVAAAPSSLARSGSPGRSEAQSSKVLQTNRIDSRGPQSVERCFVILQRTTNEAEVKGRPSCVSRAKGTYQIAESSNLASIHASETMDISSTSAVGYNDGLAQIVDGVFICLFCYFVINCTRDQKPQRGLSSVG